MWFDTRHRLNMHQSLRGWSHEVLLYRALWWSRPFLYASPSIAVRQTSSARCRTVVQYLFRPHSSRWTRTISIFFFTGDPVQLPFRSYAVLCAFNCTWQSKPTSSSFLDCIDSNMYWAAAAASLVYPSAIWSFHVTFSIAYSDNKTDLLYHALVVLRRR